MIVELAHFTLIASTMLSSLQIMRLKSANAFSDVSFLSMISSLFVLFAFLGLTYAFVTYDGSVRYVFQNANATLPWYYRISAVWGAHEGSMLLWLLIIAAWQLIVRHTHMNDPHFKSSILAMMGGVSACIGLYVVFFSNPFLRTLIVPSNGMGLNPLLQHPGLVIHPPILYLGYVGMIVPFCAVMGQSLSNSPNFDWLAVRRLLLLAWGLLSIGIVLGSWWAYHVLGWGGWWFWDPVENVSFLPWLMAGLMIHLSLIQDTNRLVKEWWNLSAILLMTLILLGVFLVRSGVLVSVHTFASDASRGLALLFLLAIQLCLSLYYYQSRMHNNQVANTDRAASWKLWIPVLVYAFTLLFVLIGTIYPLVIQALGLGQLSIGAPYFNQLLMPAVLVALLGIPLIFHPLSNKRSVIHLLLSIVVAGLFLFLMNYPIKLQPLFWLSLIVFIVSKHKVDIKKASFWGHLGFYLLVAAVALNVSYSSSKNVLMKEGDHDSFLNYDIALDHIESGKNDHFSFRKIHMTVEQDGHFTNLSPELRWFQNGETLIPISSIFRSFKEDVMISLGQSTENGWTLRFLRQPWIQWIWFSGLIIALSGFVGFFSSEKRSVK